MTGVVGGIITSKDKSSIVNPLCLSTLPECRKEKKSFDTNETIYLEDRLRATAVLPPFTRLAVAWEICSATSVEVHKATVSNSSSDMLLCLYFYVTF